MLLSIVAVGVFHQQRSLQSLHKYISSLQKWLYCITMLFQYPEYYPAFFTATILEWKRLLQPAKYKQIIISSLAFLTQNNRAIIYGFVIMDNHIHITWQAKPGYKLSDLQHSLLKFTAQQIKFDLQVNHRAVLDKFKVQAKDREYQFWERNALSVELFNIRVFEQKLQYIHDNPVRASLCKFPFEYHFSSVKFYETGIDDFGFLMHYKG